MDKISLLNRLNSGYDFLLRHCNEDNGIPAVSASDGSGCWTTAATLEALLSTPCFYPDIPTIKLLIEFLCNLQLKSPKKQAGSWALTAGGKQGSTLATAHVLVSLKRAQTFPGIGMDLNNEITKALAWISHNQNDDGGWGVEPTDGKAGKKSRMVSTFMTLRALGECGEKGNSSRRVRLGVNWIFEVYDNTGGFRAGEGEQVDPCSTSRACIALKAVDAFDERPSLLANVTKYLEGCKPFKQLWGLHKESYVPEGASGQIFFNQNSTSELLSFFSEFHIMISHQQEILSWFIENQNDDGSWCLGANYELDQEIVMWPTADALLAIGSFLRNWEFPVPNDQHAPVRRWKELAGGIAFVIAVVEFLLIIGMPQLAIDTLNESWDSLPEEFRISFLWAFGMGIFASVFAAGVVASLSLLFKRLKKND